MKTFKNVFLGALSVVVSLFSASCSSDDDTANKDNVISVEAVFANDGITRAAIGGDGTAARQMSFELGDVLRLVKKDDNSITVDFRSYHNDTSDDGANKKIFFRGILPSGSLSDYDAYLISSTSSYAAVPALSGVSAVESSLDDAFKKHAVIKGSYAESKFTLSLRNAFVWNSTEETVYLYYNTVETPVSISAGGAVAVAEGVSLKKNTGSTGTSAVANTIYKY